MLVAEIAFFVLAVVAVASALGVVLFRNAVYCMLSLILNLLSLAFFFLTLDAVVRGDDSGSDIRRRRHDPVPLCGDDALTRLG